MNLDNFFSLFSNLCNIYKPCREYNPNPQAPHPPKNKRRRDFNWLIFFFPVSPLNNFISNKKIKSMVQGKHDFFTNQFLPFALVVELQPINLKIYCAMWYHLCSTGAFRDSGAGAGAGAGLGNFWKRWVRVRRDSAIKKYFYLYFLYIAKHIFSHYTNIYQI